jgi:hypothetical protein
MLEALNQRGIPVIWVNLEDLGNWAFKRNEVPVLNIHIFGRASTAVKQKWPEAVYLPDRSTGFYDDFVPLDTEDMAQIRTAIEKRFLDEKYSDESWKLLY